MAMRQQGHVTQVEGDRVKIRVLRESACGGNCVSCQGCPTGAVVLDWPNDPQRPFWVGEPVELEMPTGRFFRGMVWSYGMPAALMVAGAILGYAVSHADGGAALGAFGGVLAGILIVRWTSRRLETGIRVLRREDAGPNAE